jgi:hypothetical protein
MKWLIDLFKVKEDEVYTGSSELHLRITEIQARIAAVRSRNGWDQEPHKNTKIQSQPLAAQEKPKVNKVSSDDLKARLLSIKK